MLRISSGSAKNKRLESPAIPGFRAVQEVVKMAIFSIIGDKITNAVCLDLFAGSGNMGIESLSRGASECDFVDSHGLAYEVIEKNLFNCGFVDKARIIKKESAKYVAKLSDEGSKKYDIIFADPFYNDTAHTHLIRHVENIMNQGAILVFLHGESLDFTNLLTQTSLALTHSRKFNAGHFEILTKNK